jgi:hypothetical protein
MKTNLRWSVLLVVAFAGAIFFACKKDNSVDQEIPPGKQHVSIYLTDHPAFFDQVLIDIRSVSVLIDTCNRNDSAGNDDDDNDNENCWVWDSLDIRTGVYDLLTLRNGVDTLFATGVIPEGRIKKIRIRLGDDNALVKDSLTYPLDLPRGFEDITIKIRGGDWDEFEPGRLRLWLDFDAKRSIVFLWNNRFMLKPVIHAFVPKTTGSIEGRVTPDEANAVISVYNGTDTAYALPFRDGKFKVRGLQEGSYTVFVNASNGYQDETINDVEVKRNRDTKLETISLEK